LAARAGILEPPQPRRARSALWDARQAAGARAKSLCHQEAVAPASRGRASGEESELAMSVPHDHSIWSFCYARGRLPADFMGGCPACSNQGLVEVPMVYSLVATH